MADPVLELDLSIGLPEREVRLRLAASSPRIAVVGPSGSGKSTLLRALAGVQPRVRGRLSFRGLRWLDSDGAVAPERRRVGWVPQDALLFPHVDVRGNLLWAASDPARLADVARAFRCETLLERRPRHLSGGERQRVALARAVLAEPRLLLLDEPLAALDRPLRGDITAALLEHCRRTDTAFVLVSHDEHDVSRLADVVYTLSEGGLSPAS